MIIVKDYSKKETQERQRLQAYIELKFYEEHGHFSNFRSKGVAIAHRIVLSKRHSNLLYEKRKQRLIDSIILDTKSKGEKRESL